MRSRRPRRSELRSKPARTAKLALGRHRHDRGGVGFRWDQKAAVPDQAPGALNVSEEGESHVQQMSPARYSRAGEGD
jgi:hypothetical protein